MDEHPFRILILSDIHFGSWSHYVHDWSPPIMEPTRWADALIGELASCLASPFRAGPPYAAVVLNGDVTSQCEEPGFVGTRHLVRVLLEHKFSDSLDKILLLPGNHDVQRDLRPHLALPQGEREKIFRKQYRHILGRPHRSNEHLGVLKVYPDAKVALFGLDSCRVEGSDNPGVGYVGFDQMEQMARTLEEVWEKRIGPFRRLAFVHHHIEVPSTPEPEWLWTPQEERRFSFMGDSKRIRDGLELFEIDFLIHGHDHCAELGLAANQKRQCGRVISVGSVGGKVAYCHEETRNFMVVELWERDLVIYDFRSKAAGTWGYELHTFEMQPRRSIRTGEHAHAARVVMRRSSESELQRYWGWVTACRLFAGDVEVVASVKKRIAPQWSKRA